MYTRVQCDYSFIFLCFLLFLVDGYLVHITIDFRVKKKRIRISHPGYWRTKGSISLKLLWFARHTDKICWIVNQFFFIDSNLLLTFARAVIVVVNETNPTNRSIFLHRVSCRKTMREKPFADRSNVTFQVQLWVITIVRIFSFINQRFISNRQMINDTVYIF